MRLFAVPLVVALCAAPTAFAGPTARSSGTGGQEYGATEAPETEGKPTVPGTRAKLLDDGTAAAPELAPPAVQKAIWATNLIVGKPYRYGGGHRSFKDSAYDCSGTVSVALNAAGTLRSPLDSSSFMSWGAAGEGDWITVYTHPGHAFVVIAGLRLDTSAAGDPSGDKGPRWRPTLRSTSGFKRRHPAGL